MRHLTTIKEFNESELEKSPLLGNIDTQSEIEIESKEDVDSKKEDSPTPSEDSDNFGGA